MKPSLQAQILQLSIPEKLQPIEDIWESLELEQIPLTEVVVSPQAKQFFEDAQASLQKRSLF